MQAIRTLLSSIVDYAGLFPPAKLEMAETISRYAACRAGSDRWILGRLVIPVARFEEFERLAHGVLPVVSGPTHDDAWGITALTAPAGDPGFARDIEAIEQFNDRHAERGADAAYVDCIEVKAGSADAIDAALDLVTDDLFPYFEIPVDRDPRGLIAALAGLDAGAKIRTGGLVADAHPTVEQVAGFLLACARAEVPFKATAGLHHPLRHEAREVGCRQHGFLNLFVGAALAMTGAIDEAGLITLLGDEDATSFRVADDGIAWRDRRLTVGQLRQSRDAFAHAFGSCSIDEPLADLRALRLLAPSSAKHS